MRILLLSLLMAVFLSACGSFSGKKADNRNAQDKREDARGSIFDSGGPFEGAAFTVGGSRVGPQGSGIGVNAYLWHASLETVNFLPLHQVDPFGGVIITDWHTPSNSTDERIKLNVFIVGTVLRSDALDVTLFRETLQNGNWVSSQTNPNVAQKIENAILERARERRLQSISSPQ